MSKPYFWKKKRKAYYNMSSAELFSQMLRGKGIDYSLYMVHANIEETDETLQKAASDQGLH